MGINGQVCFAAGFLLTLSNYEGTLQGLWSHWVPLTRTCVVPNCCQRLSQPYAVNCICFCYLVKTQHCCLCPCGRYNPPWLPALPHHPPPEDFTHSLGHIEISFSFFWNLLSILLVR